MASRPQFEELPHLSAWPSFIDKAPDGREAFGFVEAVAARFPGLLSGIGAPFFDRLLERPGFADEWRRSANQALRKQLGFRLALLRQIGSHEVDASSAVDVAEDLVRRPWDLVQRADGEALLDALETCYGATWRATLSSAILHSPHTLQALLPFALVRRALPAPPDERALLALSCDDPFAAFDGVSDQTALLALSTHALSFAAEQTVATRARLAAFVLLSRRGFAAPAALVERRALTFSDEFPEGRSALACEALARLPEAARTALIMSAPFPWKYAGLVVDAQAIDAALAALGNLSAMDRVWSIRAFHDFGSAGRAALASSSSREAKAIADALDAYARFHPRRRALDDLAPELQSAIHAAMDALDADPAAWPPRRFQFPVLDFGVTSMASARFNPSSWAMVETWAKTGMASMIVDELRRLPRETEASKTPRQRDARQVEMLIALTTLILPVWEALHPGDERPHRLVDDAKKILAGDIAEHGEERASLYAYAYADNVDRGGSCVALAAIWTHALALDDDGNTVQDTPPDLAVTAFTSLAANGATPTERARRFWEIFFLEIVPDIARRY